MAIAGIGARAAIGPTEMTTQQGMARGALIGVPVAAVPMGVIGWRMGSGGGPGGAALGAITMAVAGAGIGAGIGGLMGALWAQAF